MRVCFFQGGFATNGGIGRVVSLLSDALAKKGEEIFLCALYERRADSYYETNPLCKKSELFPYPLSMAKAMAVGHAVKKLTAYLRENRIDILIACGALYYPLCTLAAKKAETKLICWEHISPRIKTDYKFQDVARCFGARRSDCNVQLTKAALEIYNKRFPKKNNIQIYNPIDSALLERDYSYDTDSKTIVSVGRLCYQKNFQRLLDIAAAVLPSHPDWRWEIYGEGDMREELEAKCSDLGLSDRVIFMGHVGDLYDRYKSCAVMVMTSRYEGFPMTLLEGAASGLPMVSFDIETGPSEIITDGESGFLIPEDDDEKMISSINRLIEDTELRKKCSAASRRTAADFSITKITEDWMEVFKSL